MCNCFITEIATKTQGKCKKLSCGIFTKSQTQAWFLMVFADFFETFLHYEGANFTAMQDFLHFGFKFQFNDEACRGRRPRRPANICTANIGIFEENHYLLPCGNVILFQNHRAVEGAGPYDPIIEQLAKPGFSPWFLCTIGRRCEALRHGRCEFRYEGLRPSYIPLYNWACGR